MENINNIYGGNPIVGRIVIPILLASLALYVLVLAVNGIKTNKYIGRDATGQASITVSGNGDISAKPDLAVMDFSVVSEAKTVAEASDDNSKKMNAIIEAVKKLGVEDKDLQTTGYNISPRYDYIKQVPTPTLVPMPLGAGSSGSAVTTPVSDTVYYPNGKQVLAGYVITQTLTVKMRDMTKIGQIIEATTAAGANQAGDLQFTLDNPDAVQAQAREKAISDANAKAQILAKQLNVRLVRITNFNESGYYPTARLSYAKDSAVGASEAAVAPNIQTGENKVTVNVSMTYEIE